MLWLSGGLAVALVILGVETSLLIEVVRQQDRILLRLDTLETRSGMPDRAAVPNRPGLTVGQTAPAFTPPGLYGETMTLDALVPDLARAGFRGKETMLLFWNPGCGFCQQMVDGVKALKRG